MNGVSRRRFLVSSLVGGLAAGLGRLPASAQVTVEETPAEILPGLDREMLEALMDRIVPAWEGKPGAVEANGIGFLSRFLADEQSPFREVYRAGLEGVAALCRQRFDKPLVELSPRERDEILRSMESGEATGWPEGPVGAQDFFETLRTHTIWGFLADPKYGGNLHYAGWRAAGYPGSGHPRGIRSKQVTGEADILPVWDPRY